MDKIRHSFGDALRKRPLLFRGPLCFFPLLMIFFAACSGGGAGGGSAPKAITGFSLQNIEAEVRINPANRTVLVTVPAGTALTTALTPDITHNGAAITPASGVAQTFSTAAAYTPVVYTVTAEDGSQAIWTVMVRLEPAASTVSGVATYITQVLTADSTAGSSAANPIFLPVSLNLAGSGWSGLLSTINTAGKYVALDLSACTMTGTEFDPGAAGTGEGKIVSLVLPDAAKSVKAGTYDDPAFENFTALTSVAAAGVQTVGEYAFAFCTGLETVSLPAATSIGEGAFWNCTALTTLSIPAAVSIGEGAFFGCTALTTLSIPVVQHIGLVAFEGCTALETVSLPASLSSIGENPFRGCTRLDSIAVAAGNPNYKHSADGKMILSKDGKTLVAFPSASGSLTLNGITSVGATAFYKCTALTTLNLPAAQDIGDYAFYDCTALTTLSLPAAQDIGDYAFYKCTALTTLSIPAAVSIGRGAFYGCTALETVSLPAAINIGATAFGGCTALTTLSLPAAVSIGEDAFESTGTQSLIVTLGSTPPWLGTDMFGYIYSAKTVTVKVPSGATAWDSIVSGSPYSGSDTTDNWGNAFRGKGWDGANYLTGWVNNNITLTIETYTP